MSDQTQKRVLVLCTGNSCRSQMAEALINDRLDAEWLAFSAGTHPAGVVNPFAVKALEEIGISVGDQHPKHVGSFSGQSFDLVITVCDDAAQSCPVWPGQGKRVHVGFPDPADAEGSEEEVLAVFRAVRDDIEARLLPLLWELP